MREPRDINEARTFANMSERAANLTRDYHATILDDSVLVARRNEPGHSYTVRNGACTCPAFGQYGTCKHEQGLVPLVEAEIKRLRELCSVMESGNARRAIERGRMIVGAASCEMSVSSYREALERCEAAD